MNQGEDKLYHDPKLTQFYDLDDSPRVDFDAFVERVARASTILDLGCGTGTLTTRIAETYSDKKVMGVDPAEAMLEIARGKSDKVQWICVSAEDFNLELDFDLILLSGHAFQVFLTKAQRESVFQVMKTQLNPIGTILFDSRNPWVEEWREWTPELSRETYHHPKLGKIISWNDVVMTDDIVHYFTYYQEENGAVHSAESMIAFPMLEEIQKSAESCGLVINRVEGDWLGNPYRPDSPEMVIELAHAQ